MAGEDVPDLARVLDFGLAYFQVFHRDALAVEHPVNVVIGLHKQFGRIGKGFIPRKPRGLRVPVRAHDRQRADVGIKRTRDGSR